MFQNGPLQSVPELQDLFRTVLTGKFVHRIAQEAGCNAVLVVLIRRISTGSQVFVDHDRETAASNIGIQPPVGFRIFYRFQFIGNVAVFQIITAIPPEGESHALYQLRHFGKKHGRFVFRLCTDIKTGNQRDCGNFSNGLIHQHGERPPDPVRIFF